MQQNLRLSVSKTKVFLACKKQFKFNYILKLPSKEMPYHTLGKICHDTLENFHKSYIFNNSTEPFYIEIGKAFKGAVEKYKNKITPDMHKEAKGFINEYLQIITNDKNNNLSANVLDCEKNFNVSLTDDINIVGIDRIQLDRDGVLHLADYKTSKSKKFLENDFFQLQTYGLIMLMEDPTLEKIRLSYIMLRHNYEYITETFTADELWKIKDKYIEYAEQIRNEKDYPATTSILCNYCSYLEHCEEGKTIQNPAKRIGQVDW